MAIPAPSAPTFLASRQNNNIYKEASCSGMASGGMSATFQKQRKPAAQLLIHAKIIIAYNNISSRKPSLSESIMQKAGRKRRICQLSAAKRKTFSLKIYKNEETNMYNIMKSINMSLLWKSQSKYMKYQRRVIKNNQKKTYIKIILKLLIRREAS